MRELLCLAVYAVSTDLPEALKQRIMAFDEAGLRRFVDRYEAAGSFDELLADPSLADDFN